MSGAQEYDDMELEFFFSCQFKHKHNSMYFLVYSALNFTVYYFGKFYFFFFVTRVSCPTDACKNIFLSIIKNYA